MKGRVGVALAIEKCSKSDPWDWNYLVSDCSGRFQNLQVITSGSFRNLQVIT